MEQTFSAACAAHDLPGVVLLATSRDGKFEYSKSFGNLSVTDDDAAKSGPISPNSPMWIASCTKLLTTIAALQCVERGLLSLDADVTPILHELKDIEILTGFDAAVDGKPTYVKAQHPITLRQLLTHSSGLAYDLFNPMIQQWRKTRGEPIAPGTTVLEHYLGPLLFEPGSSWEYSPAIDFVGLMVERVTGAASLQAYMDKEIWAPLGIKDMTFFIHERSDLSARMPVMMMRDATSGKVVPKPAVPQEPPKDAMGGGGIYATPAEYLKVLHAVLRNEGTLLREETVLDMFRPHLSEASGAALMKLLMIPEVNEMMGAMPEGTERNFGLGGMVVLDDLEGWTKKGTLRWGGMPNLTWWIDMEAGICGLYAGQILPPGDSKSVKMSALFEKTMYERLQKEKDKATL